MERQTKIILVLACAATFGGVTVFSRDTCGPPDEIEGALLINATDPDGGVFENGAVVVYRCERGMDMEGIYNSRTCRNGGWSRPEFTCNYRTCGFIDHPEHGKRLDWNNTPGEFTAFECDYGYIRHGPQEMLCRVGGTWRPKKPPTCTPVFCPDPMDIEHGSLFQESRDGIYNDFGSVVMYKCDEYYTLQGLATRRCMGDGQWEGEEPTCYQPACPAFDPFPNGRVWYNNDQIRWQTVAQFRCNEKADLFPAGTTFSICLPHGEWNVYPECRQQLEVIPSDNIIIDNKEGRRWRRIWQRIWIPSEGRIRVSCKRKYELFHDDYLDIQSRQCVNNNGVWKPPFPECKEARCDVPYISNGHLELQNGQVARGKVEHDAELKTVCDEKYEIEEDKHSKIICNKGDIERPKCAPRRCTLPEKSSELVLYTQNGRPYKDHFIGHTEKIKVSCKGNDHELVIRNTRNQPPIYVPDFSSTCDYGDLNPKHFPTCEEKRCDLGEFDDNSYDKIRDEHGKTVKEKMIQSNTAFILMCSNGHHFKGAEEKRQRLVHCIKGKIINATECEPDPCVRPNVTNAEPESNLKAFPHNFEIKMVCNEGHEYPDGSEKKLVKCSLGNWTRIPSECTEKKCTVRQIHGLGALSVVDERNNTLQAHETVESGNTVSLRCKEGFESDRKQPMLISCSKGAWSGSLGCTSRECPVPMITNARIHRVLNDEMLDQNDTVPSEEMITIVCDSGYELEDGNDKLRAKCSHGIWDAEAPSECSSKKCLLRNITNFYRLQITSEQGELPDVISNGTVIQLSCKPGFEPQSDIKESSCILGEWSETLICLAPNCTVPDIQRATMYLWPGMTPLVAGESLSDNQRMFIACDKDYVIDSDDVKDQSPSPVTHKKIKCREGDWVEPPPESCMTANQVLGKCDTKAPENGEITFGHTAMGTVIKVTCNKDHKIIHSGSTELRFFQTLCINGTLQKQLPVCKRIEGRQNIDCKYPPSIEYSVAYNKQDKSQFEGYARHNTKIDVSCRTEKGGKVRATCFDGTWEPSIPSCDKEMSKSCQLQNDARFKYDGGDLSPGDEVRHGKLVGVSCAQSSFYEMYYDGGMSNNILCHHGKLFGMKSIECEEVLTEECNASVEHGMVKKIYGEFKVVCDDGYSLTVADWSEFTCDKGFMVTKFGNERAKCIQNNCTLPEYLTLQVEKWPIQNGRTYFSGSMKIKHQDKILLNCTQSGYEPNSRIVQCVAGKWKETEPDWDIDANGTFPECRPAICEPKCKNFGVCIRDNQCRCMIENKGERCEEFKCPECEANNGTCPRSRECICPKNKVGKNCEQYGCRTPKPGAKIKNEQLTYNVGESVELTCGPGERLEGDKQLVCLDSGDWEGNATCVEMNRIMYRIRTITGGRFGAGTDADIYLQIYGENGQKTGEIELTKDIYGKWNKFEQGHKDEFNIELNDVGNIAHIEIRMHEKGVAPDWFLKFVSIYDSAGNKYYGFPVGQWIEGGKVTLEPSRGCGDTFTAERYTSVLRYDVTCLGNMDEISCKLACIEMGSSCYGSVYYSKSVYCCVLRPEQFTPVYQKYFVSYRNYCNVKRL